jgi:hypothetical protein
VRPRWQVARRSLRVHAQTWLDSSRLGICTGGMGAARLLSKGGMVLDRCPPGYLHGYCTGALARRRRFRLCRGAGLPGRAAMTSIFHWFFSLPWWVVSEWEWEWMAVVTATVGKLNVDEFRD